MMNDTYLVICKLIVRTRFLSKAKFFCALFILTAFVGCESSEQKADREKIKAAKEFPDGTYSCVASNLTTGNGPYSLSCDKSSEDVVLHFENGGYIQGSLVEAADHELVFNAIDSRDNEWIITISK